MANDEMRSAGWLCGFIALAASPPAQAVDLRIQRAELGPIIAVVDTVASTTSAK